MLHLSNDGQGTFKPEEGGGWQLPDMNVLGIDTAYTARARCSCSRRDRVNLLRHYRTCLTPLFISTSVFDEFRNR